MTSPARLKWVNADPAAANAGVGPMAQIGQTDDERRADAEPMSSIKDLLAPEVRRALAELVAARQPAVSGDLGDDLPEQVGDRADREGREQHGRRPAPPSQQI